jgi:MFS family permease
MPARTDATTILTTRGIRSFGDGFVSVLLASYLTDLGFGGGRVGAVATAALLGTALSTLAVGAWTERLGRRRTLIFAAGVAAITGVAMASVDVFVLIILVAFVGTLNPSAGDVSVFLPVEQAILPQTIEDRSRTALFARYNIVGAVAASFGALFAAVPGVAERWTALDATDVTRAMFVLYGGMALAKLA